jgi:ATP-binding cassette, subfamily C (CFTR/MRP), member 1
VNRWLSVRLEFLGALIILTVAFLAMSALITTGVDAGLVGLVLSYALNTTSALVSETCLACNVYHSDLVFKNWAVRSASEVEQNIVSVERILHQTQVEPEAPHEILDAKPDVDGVWPSQGAIEFR